MPRNRITEEAGSMVDLDLTKWRLVDIYNLNAADQEIFLRRKMAIELYIQSDIPIKEITAKTKIIPKEIRRLLRRCLEFDELGEIWGYRALIPMKHIKTYKRESPTSIKDCIDNDSIKLTGAFQLLLDTYPDIRKKIHDLYFNKNKNEVTESIMSTKYLHRHFLKACRKVGINPATDYPFNTADQGKRSLQRYVKQLEKMNFKQAMKRYGNDATKIASTTGVNGKNYPLVVRPYKCVEFDGHRVDGMFTFIFTTPEGDQIEEVLERFWVLSIIDVATRSILGYHICLNKEYSAADVLTCVRKAIEPWKPRERFVIPGLKYNDSAGFPSGLFADSEWALWDEMYYDQAKSNLAGIVKDKLKRLIGCSVNIGPVATPVRRPFIERFFQTLEENSYHRLPNTTGSKPSDPRRQKPEKKAKEYRISYEDFEEITEVLIANYNSEPHYGCNYLAPLEVMELSILVQ